MNEKLFRPQFNRMETSEKKALMESLAARYNMTFLGLQTFDRWGQNCTTGIFEKDEREFVFVPGDTVTLGWEQFAVGLNNDSKEELDYLFKEWEMERDPEEMIRESMAPVRQATIGPMLVGRKLEELCWESVNMDDPRLTAHPFELIQQEPGIHVRYRNDWHIGAMPERYTYDKAGQKQPLNELALDLAPGEYGRAVCNGRFRDWDTGIWYYVLDILNVMPLTEPTDSLTSFTDREPNKIYTQIDRLW